jgi:hypothetical protein
MINLLSLQPKHVPAMVVSQRGESMRAVLWNCVLSIAAVASFWTTCLDAEELPAHRGLYAIWAPHDALDLPYITGDRSLCSGPTWSRRREL